MKHTLSRRNFLTSSVVSTAAISIAATAGVSAQEPSKTADGSFPSAIYKAQIVKTPDDARCEKLKSAGFDGIEVTAWDISVEEAQKNRQIAEKHDLKVHSVMRGWTNVNTDSFDKDIESVKKAFKTAAAYGADTVLWVPCRTGGWMNPKIGKPKDGVAMPAAWDFDIDFDPATLKVKSVAADGDYAEYVAVQNQATEAAIKAVELLLPAAAYEGVKLGIENVWNNLWSTPKYYAALCKYFKSPWVGPYFDLGNHTVYANPVEWLKALGIENQPFKLHIKGFKVNEVKGKLGGGPGDWCKIDEASIDWKSVRQVLRDIHYNGWISVEEGGYSDEKYSQILDSIIG
jgi:sugar phosphate isomerase/epimerase